MEATDTESRVNKLSISAATMVPLEPYGKIATFFRSADGLRAAGVWTVDEGQQFDYELPYDLFVYVVDGELRVATQDGGTVTLSRGDVAYFVAEQFTKWSGVSASRAVFCCVSEKTKIDF